MINDFGWIDDPDQVDLVLESLPMPMVGQLQLPKIRANKAVLLTDTVRKITGKDIDKGPQGIGDCVGWGWARLVNIIACTQIAASLSATFGQDQESRDFDQALQQVREEFQQTSVEAIYALSRVEVGKQKGSMQDGSVGAWAAKAVSTYGTLSYKALKQNGYDKTRSKNWGAQGLPDSLEPAARLHLVKNVSLVTTFDQAAALVENGYPTAVCSSQGFTMTRDRNGFCAPRGRWDHCMTIVGVRYDIPGCLIAQNWGANTPNGPLVLGQPDNTFWVDAHTINNMLARRDSFTGTAFDGYPAQQDIIDWSH